MHLDSETPACFCACKHSRASKQVRMLLCSGTATQLLAVVPATCADNRAGGNAVRKWDSRSTLCTCLLQGLRCWCASGCAASWLLLCYFVINHAPRAHQEPAFLQSAVWLLSAAVHCRLRAATRVYMHACMLHASNQDTHRCVAGEPGRHCACVATACRCAFAEGLLDCKL